MVRGRRERLGRVLERDALGAAQAAQLVEARVEDDAVEPRAELGLSFEPRQRLECIHVRVLECVVHPIARAEQPVRERAELWVVVPDEDRERLVVAAAGAVEDSGLDLGHGVGSHACDCAHLPCWTARRAHFFTVPTLSRWRACSPPPASPSSVSTRRGARGVRRTSSRQTARSASPWIRTRGSGVRRAPRGRRPAERRRRRDVGRLPLARAGRVLPRCEPRRPAGLAGTEPSRLFASNDAGTTWEALDALLDLPSRPTWSFPPRPWTSHVRWIAPSPHDPELLLAGIELGGLMRSADGGRSWEDHRPGAQRDVHCLAWHPRVAGRAYEAGGGGSAFSVDGGETWTPADEGRDRNYTWAVAVDPDDPDLWYVSASTGPFAAHGGGEPRAHVYRRRAGEPWEALGGGLPEPLPAMPYALVATVGRLFAGLANGQLWESCDRGDTWAACEVVGGKLKALVALAGG